MKPGVVEVEWYFCKLWIDKQEMEYGIGCMDDWIISICNTTTVHSMLNFITCTSYLALKKGLWVIGDNDNQWQWSNMWLVLLMIKTASGFCIICVRKIANGDILHIVKDYQIA